MESDSHDAAAVCWASRVHTHEGIAGPWQRLGETLQPPLWSAPLRKHAFPEECCVFRCAKHRTSEYDILNSPPQHLAQCLCGFAHVHARGDAPKPGERLGKPEQRPLWSGAHCWPSLMESPLPSAAHFQSVRTATCRSLYIDAQRPPSGWAEVPQCVRLRVHADFAWHVRGSFPAKPKQPPLCDGVRFTP